MFENLTTEEKTELYFGSGIAKMRQMDQDGELTPSIRQDIVAFGIKILVDILGKPSLSINDYSKALKIYNLISSGKSIVYINRDKNLQDSYDNVSNLLIARLNEQNEHGKTIGDLLIKDRLKTGSIIELGLLQYDAYKTYQYLKLQSKFKPMVFGSNGKGASMDSETNTLYFDTQAFYYGDDFGVNALFSIKKRFGKTPDDINLGLLYILRHEISHLYYHSMDPNSKDVLERFKFFNTRIQKAESSSMSKGSGHICEHINMPDEIDADVNACKVLEHDLETTYTSVKKTQLVKKLREFINKRISNAHKIQEDGTILVKDYTEYILVEAIKSGKLDEAETQKVKELLRKYRTIKKQAKINGVKLYADRLSFGLQLNTNSAINGNLI